MADQMEARIEAAWDAVSSSADQDVDWLRDRLAPLIAAARANSELRQLFPFTSVNRLCFSRCSDYPFTLDCPCVAVGGGGYQVQESWAVTDEQGPPLLEMSNNLDEVIDVVVAHLPLDRTTWIGTDRHDR